MTTRRSRTAKPSSSPQTTRTRRGRSSPSSRPVQRRASSSANSSRSRGSAPRRRRPSGMRASTRSRTSGGRPRTSSPRSGGSPGRSPRTSRSTSIPASRGTRNVQVTPPLPIDSDEGVPRQGDVPDGPLSKAALREGDRCRGRGAGPRDSDERPRQQARSPETADYDRVRGGGLARRGDEQPRPSQGGNRVSASETDLRRAVTILDQYRAQLESLQRQQEVLSLSLEELMRAKETLSRFQKAGKEAEILVPVGANAFVFGQVADASRALIGIGSDVVLKEPIPKAVERLDGRIR